MRIDRPTTLPPQWAESLLRMFLSPADRDSVSGDLLDEYRESIRPERGAGANRWYARQVGWYVLRATGPWSAPIVLMAWWSGPQGLSCADLPARHRDRFCTNRRSHPHT